MPVGKVLFPGWCNLSRAERECATPWGPAAEGRLRAPGQNSVTGAAASPPPAEGSSQGRGVLLCPAALPRIYFVCVTAARPLLRTRPGKSGFLASLNMAATFSVTCRLELVVHALVTGNARF